MYFIDVGSDMAWPLFGFGILGRAGTDNAGQVAAERLFFREAHFASQNDSSRAMAASTKPATHEAPRRPSRGPLVIGQWIVDPPINELRRGDQAVRVEPKAMDVLVFLAEHAGRLVSREELFAAVWPGVVVGDEALTQTINKLRKAFGDASRSPSYIETIAKRGYRLIAEVRPWQETAAIFGPAPASGSSEAASTDATPPPLPSDALPSSAAGTRRRASTALLLALLAIAVAIGYFAVRPFAPIDAPESFDADAFRQPGWIGVAVAPFDSLGGDPEQAYLAQGITVGLITDLSRLSGLRVIRLPDRARIDRDASGVQYRMTGSVQRDAGRLRITVHLVDARTGEELWSERFDRPFGDILAMQDEITARIVQLLPAKVSDVERLRISRRYTQSADAYDDFLRAQALLLVRGVEANERARTLYRSALELDPKFARAYAGLAMTYAMDYRLRDSQRPSLDRAFELARTAREIDADAPEVHWAMGFVQAQARQHGEAIKSLQQAIVLDRSFADAYALLGGIYTYTGQPERSIELLRTALKLNPNAGYLYFLVLGRALLFENDPEQALIHLRAAALRNPADVETRVFIAAALAAAGDRAGALWEAEEIRTLEPSFSTRRWLDSYPMTSAAQQARLITLLTDAGL
jgi:DNA-binding winged helix-turn-helix (wHTH) protein/TolB-like protein/Flp pilus assembly protein TadD